MLARTIFDEKKIFKTVRLLLFLIIIFSLKPYPHNALGFDGGDPPNIILFSWDGFQRNHFLQLYRNGSLPNMKNFVDNGVLLNLTVYDYLTQTKSGHAQMLTGYRGKITGVYSNTVYFHPVPDGYSLLERVEDYFGPENVVTCMITGKKKNIEVDRTAMMGKSEYCDRGIFSNIPEDIDVTQVTEDPAFIAGMRMIEFIGKYSSEHFVAFFHLQEPDVQGHAFGENSKEYDWGAMSCDHWLGKILDKLQETNIMDTTLIYVSTDHGFNENDFHHRSDPDIWMATNDLKLGVNEEETRCDMIDIAPTIYYSLGIDLYSFTPRLEGYPLQEKLPREANERIGLFYEIRPPIIEFDPIIKGVKISPGQSLDINFNISDDKPIVSYLLLNKTMLGTFRQEEELPVFKNYLFKLNGEYNLEASKHEAGKYVLEIVAFDERENMRKMETNIFIRSQPETPLEKIAQLITRNTSPLLYIGVTIALILMLMMVLRDR